MLQCKFKVPRIAGSINTGDNFLFRLELKVTEKIRLKIREHIETTLIEVITSSSHVADEEQFFFTRANNESEPEEQTIQRKELYRQSALEWVADNEPSKSSTSMKEFTKTDGNATSSSMN